MQCIVSPNETLQKKPTLKKWQAKKIGPLPAQFDATTHVCKPETRQGFMRPFLLTPPLSINEKPLLNTSFIFFLQGICRRSTAQKSPWVEVSFSLSLSPIPSLNLYDFCLFFPCLISNQCKSSKILVSAIINMNCFLYGQKIIEFSFLLVDLESSLSIVGISNDISFFF